MTASVAIITRTKDRPRLLRRAIESVLNQSFQDWCHVIVNDGGDRSALELLVEDYPSHYQERLQIVHHDTSRGMQVATNAGVAASESIYLCVHDDDDSWDPDYLKTCVGFLEAEGTESLYQGVITQTLEIRERIDAKGDPETIDRRPYIPLSEISLFRLGYENPFPPIAFCYRRTAYETIGPYDPRFSVAGDYDFNFRFLRRYEVGVVDQPLAYYHVRVGNNTEWSNSVVTGASEHKKRYNEFKNHYLRGADTEVNPALAVGLNAAKYLVELEWLAHEIRQRAEKIEGVSAAAADRIPAIESQLSRSLELQDAAFRDLRAWIEDPRILDRLAIALKDLAYLSDITQTIAKRSEELAQQQDNRSNAIAAQLATTLSDLSFLNDVAGRIAARSEELAEQQDKRALDMLHEMRIQHAAVIESQREKTLLQIGPIRLAWKKKRRKATSAE